jgi:hypothetical protein
MGEALFSYAYGTRAIPKLAESLGDKERTEEQRVQTLSSLKNALSSQEEKCVAIGAKPSIPFRLAQLIHSETEPVRRLSADCLASLAMVLQGRLAIAEHDIVPSITNALHDTSPDVRTAAAGALFQLSKSRDGCALLSKDELIKALVAALDVEEAETIARALSALANLTRLDIGVAVALDADIVAKLQQCLARARASASQPLLLAALQCVFNISNTAQGKAAAIDADLLAPIAELCAPVPPAVAVDGATLRLAIGCIMAITVAKGGKLHAQSAGVVDALSAALVDVGTDAFTMRSVIAAIKNVAEHPAARAEFNKQLSPHGVDMLTIADDAVWPDSNRYVHQNVAPGGPSFASDKSMRARWGYPEPHRKVAVFQEDM